MSLPTHETPAARDPHSIREVVPQSYGTGDYPRDESGVICAECGWLLSGPAAAPDAERQHREHLSMGHA